MGIDDTECLAGPSGSWLCMYVENNGTGILLLCVDDYG